MNTRLSVVLFSIIISSCSKPAVNTLEQITDTVIGRYECSSITIQGFSLDLNNDGIASNDMIREFNGISLATERIHSPVRVFPVKEYNERRTIVVEIPKQNVNFDKRIGEYVFEDILYGDGLFVSFEYYITDSGNILTNPNNIDNDRYYREDEYIEENVDYKGNVGISLNFNQKGRIEVLIDCTCFDFSTGKVLTVPTVFVYERISYSLY